jgi:hypothetical protein
MNYWADYIGTDDNGDGIGDTAYTYQDTYQDDHPLTNQVPAIPEFTSPIMILTILSCSIIALIIYKQKLEKHNANRKKN